MSHFFAVKWLKAFRESPEAVVALYADEFLFEDPIPVSSHVEPELGNK